jgi:hypothetical protein
LRLGYYLLGIATKAQLGGNRTVQSVRGPNSESSVELIVAIEISRITAMARAYVLAQTDETGIEYLYSYLAE